MTATTTDVQDAIRARYAAGLVELDRALDLLQFADHPYLTRGQAADVLRWPISVDSVLQLTSRQVTEASIGARLDEVTA